MFGNQSKKDWIITSIVMGIGLLIVFFAALPFLKIESNFLKGLLIILALIVGGFPLGKYIYSLYKGENAYEDRHGKKLK